MGNSTSTTGRGKEGQDRLLTNVVGQDAHADELFPTGLNFEATAGTEGSDSDSDVDGGGGGGGGGGGPIPAAALPRVPEQALPEDQSPSLFCATYKLELDNYLKRVHLDAAHQAAAKRRFAVLNTFYRATMPKEPSEFMKQAFIDIAVMATDRDQTVLQLDREHFNALGWIGQELQLTQANIDMAFTSYANPMYYSETSIAFSDSLFLNLYYFLHLLSVHLPTKGVPLSNEIILAAMQLCFFPLDPHALYQQKLTTPETSNAIVVAKALQKRLAAQYGDPADARCFTKTLIDRQHQVQRALEIARGLIVARLKHEDFRPTAPQLLSVFSALQVKLSATPLERDIDDPAAMDAWLTEAFARPVSTGMSTSSATELHFFADYPPAILAQLITALDKNPSDAERAAIMQALDRAGARELILASLNPAMIKTLFQQSLMRMFPPTAAEVMARSGGGPRPSITSDDSSIAPGTPVTEPFTGLTPQPVDPLFLTHLITVLQDIVKTMRFSSTAYLAAKAFHTQDLSPGHRDFWNTVTAIIMAKYFPEEAARSDTYKMLLTLFMHSSSAAEEIGIEAEFAPKWQQFKASSRAVQLARNSIECRLLAEVHRSAAPAGWLDAVYEGRIADVASFTIPPFSNEIYTAFAEFLVDTTNAPLLRYQNFLQQCFTTGFPTPALKTLCDDALRGAGFDPASSPALHNRINNHSTLAKCFFIGITRYLATPKGIAKIQEACRAKLQSLSSTHSSQSILLATNSLYVKHFVQSFLARMEDHIYPSNRLCSASSAVLLIAFGLTMIGITAAFAVTGSTISVFTTRTHAANYDFLLCAGLLSLALAGAYAARYAVGSESETAYTRAIEALSDHMPSRVTRFIRSPWAYTTTVLSSGTIAGLSSQNDIADALGGDAPSTPDLWVGFGFLTLSSLSLVASGPWLVQLVRNYRTRLPAVAEAGLSESLLPTHNPPISRGTPSALLDQLPQQELGFVASPAGNGMSRDARSWGVSLGSAAGATYVPTGEHKGAEGSDHDSEPRQ